MGTNIKILVVEDEPAMRTVIRKYLERAGYQKVVEADTGENALKLLKADNFDLILSDWDMPGMDGLALLKAIRAQPEYIHIPFLMLTAHKEKDNVLKAIESGTNDYIVKPFTEATLKKKISDTLKS